MRLTNCDMIRSSGRRVAVGSEKRTGHRQEMGPGVGTAWLWTLEDLPTDVVVELPFTVTVTVPSKIDLIVALVGKASTLGSGQLQPRSASQTFYI